MIVRSAGPRDADRIAEIQVQGWRSGYTGILPASVLDALSVEERSKAWRERLALNPALMLVAEISGEILGWLSLGASRDSDAEGSVGEVYGLYVHPASWRRGVGRALWAEAQRRFQEAGFGQVTLWVLEENARARAFYEHLGFDLEVGMLKMFERDGVSIPEVRYRRFSSLHDGRCHRA